MEKKKWYKSKGLWLGAIVFVGGALQAFGITGAPISPEIQILIIGVLSFIIRMITKEEVGW